MLKKLFGSRNDRLLKAFKPSVSRINALGARLATLTADEISDEAKLLRAKAASGAEGLLYLEEAYAIARQATFAAIGKRHFDVQVIAALALYDRKIAEMRTGEGKTLVTVLPAFYSSLKGEQVHVVTANEYLARRDAEMLAPVFSLLGMSVGVNLATLTAAQKQDVYGCDVVFGTASEFGFDYLRDNMAITTAERVQGRLHFAIVDEADSILIDEARTPMIISGVVDDDLRIYHASMQIASRLVQEDESGGPGDFSINEKDQSAHLTEAGYAKVETLLSEMGYLPAGASLYSDEFMAYNHCVNAAIRARALFARDRHYVVQNNEIVIIDEQTGRLMPGRRWEEGLHQAVEAKEGVQINAETRILASITFQNFFRMYDRLAGMTGTAETEAVELMAIYGLETVVVPTRLPVARADHDDLVFKTASAKASALVEAVAEAHRKGQPVLVGTATVADSEFLSQLLSRAGIRHAVLNAKNHEAEASIVAEAGANGAVTVATNMAGRGTDIVLGGCLDTRLAKALASVNVVMGGHHAADSVYAETATRVRKDWEAEHAVVVKNGGLFVMGYGRNESRRVDNQLRGRAGRQGDPGASMFFLSLDDDLLRIFAMDKIKGILARVNISESTPIQFPMISRSIEAAQRRIEERNYAARKQLMEFDGVANEHAQMVYQQRRHYLEDDVAVAEAVADMRDAAIENLFHAYVLAGSMIEEWDIPGLTAALKADFRFDVDLAGFLASNPEADDEDLLGFVLSRGKEVRRLRLSQADADLYRENERRALLFVIDQKWREHIETLRHLSESVHLRSIAQKDPRREFKQEAFRSFEAMLSGIQNEVPRLLVTV